MKRYYSHYTFIYPDIYLKNHIVELDDDMKHIRFFPFEREIEKTEFYSEVLVFLPQLSLLDDVLRNKIKRELITKFSISTIYSDHLEPMAILVK